MSKKKKTVACYCRVSTKSGPQASSLNNQKSFFNDFIEKNANEYKLYKIYPDHGISGTLLHRENFEKMLIDAGLDIKEYDYTVKKLTTVSDKAETKEIKVNYKEYTFLVSDREPKFNEILVRNTSRFSRNVLIADVLRKLREKEVYVRFLDIDKTTENKADISIIQLFQNFDELFSRDLSRKVKAGNERSIANKTVRSTPRLYGYKYIKRKNLSENNRLERRKDEAEVVHRIYRLYAGCLSVYDTDIACDLNCSECNIERTAGVGERVISRCLTESGIKTRNNKEFGITAIANMLKNEKYFGYLNTGKFDAGELFSANKSVKVRDNYLLEPDTNIEAIISKELFDICQDKRKSRYDTIKSKGLPSTSSPFGGLLVCSKCGSKYLHNSDRGRGFYQCGNKKRKGVNVCNSVNVSDSILAEYMDRLTSGALSADLYKDRQDVLKTLDAAIHNKLDYIDRNKDPKQLEQLQDERNRLDKRLRSYYEQLADEEDKEGEASRTLKLLKVETKEVLSDVQKQIEKYTKKPIINIEESKVLLEYAYELINDLDTRTQELSTRTYTLKEVLNTIDNITVYGPADYNGGTPSDILLHPKLKMSEMVRKIIYNNEAIFSEDAEEEKTMETLENLTLFSTVRMKEVFDGYKAKLEVLETQYF